MQKNLYVLYILILAVLVAGYICMSNRDYNGKHGMMKPISHNELMVKDAYARASSPNAPVGAVFFVIENGTDKVAHLTAATSTVAKTVELHTHKDNGEGVMQMLEIEGGVKVGVKERSMFKRGGNHVMLMGLNQSLNTGDVIALELIFDGQPMKLNVTVNNERKAKMAH
jgi:copper(I)-binding protein